METTLKDRLLSKDTWVRLLLMLAFAFVAYVVLILIFITSAAQIILIFATGNRNSNLLRLGHGLSSFSSQILQYLTFNTEDKPYPFGQWPSVK